MNTSVELARASDYSKKRQDQFSKIGNNAPFFKETSPIPSSQEVSGEINTNLVNIMRLLNEDNETHFHLQLKENASHGLIHIPRYHSNDFLADKDEYSKMIEQGKKTEGLFYKHHTLLDLMNDVNSTILEWFEKIGKVAPAFQIQGMNSRGVNYIDENKHLELNELPQDLRKDIMNVVAAKNGKLYYERERNADLVLARSWLDIFPKLFKIVQGDVTAAKNIIQDGIKAFNEEINKDPTSIQQNATLINHVKVMFDDLDRFVKNNVKSYAAFPERFPEVSIMNLVYGFRVNILESVNMWNTQNPQKQMSYLQITHKGMQWHREMVQDNNNDNNKRKKRRRRRK